MDRKLKFHKKRKGKKTKIEKFEDVISSGKEFAHLQFQNLKFNKKYNFYYDETANIRKLYVRQKDNKITLNTIDNNFVLGGVLHKQDLDTQIIINELDSLKLTQAEDMKYKKVIGKKFRGNFLNNLESTNLKKFLTWLLDSDLYIHYSNINLFYWSIVDIIDSLDDHEKTSKFNRELKNELYSNLIINKDDFINLAYFKNYPNLQEEDKKSFIKELIKIISKATNKNSYTYMLIGILKDSIDSELPFITNEENHIFIDDFSTFYNRPINDFQKSKHIFDHEKNIEALFKKDYYDKFLLTPYEFVDSKENKFIQISDVVVGILGKYFVYIKDSELREIKQLENTLNDIQLDNLKLINKLIMKSDKENSALLHWIVSLQEIEKGYFYL